jgi:cytidine deaminase
MSIMTWKDLEKRSYSPYSGLKSACIVKGSSGVCYPGVRVENISFPLSIGAVQAAIFSCLSEGDVPGELMLPNETGTSAGEGDAAWQSGTPGNMKNIARQNLFSCTDKELRFWCEEFGLPCVSGVQPCSGPKDTIFQTGESSASVERLSELTARCIIPYSSFPVTALLVSDTGIFSGANIEVDDWQKGLCAERVALAKARASGAVSFSEIHVFAPKSDYVSPCGACRQVLVEHMGDGTMYLHHNETEISRLRVADLLPYQFKAGQLGHNN